MYKSRRLKQSAFMFLVSLISIGCSTFETYRSYELNENKRSDLTQDTGIVTSISFDRQADFSSIGIIGLPLIPIYIRIIGDNEFKLRVYLRMTEKHEFSLISRPCVAIREEERLCATDLEVSALAMFRDDGSKYNDKLPRWNHVEAFHKRGNLSFIDGQGTIPQRVAKSDIYEYYGYNGSPDWGHFNASFIYTFKCERQCPIGFKLEVDDLIEVDGKARSLTSQYYQLGKHSEYYFMRNVQ